MHVPLVAVLAVIFSGALAAPTKHKEFDEKSLVGRSGRNVKLPTLKETGLLDILPTAPGQRIRMLRPLHVPEAAAPSSHDNAPPSAPSVGNPIIDAHAGTSSSRGRRRGRPAGIKVVTEDNLAEFQRKYDRMGPVRPLVVTDWKLRKGHIPKTDGDFKCQIGTCRDMGTSYTTILGLQQHVNNNHLTNVSRFEES